MRAGPQARPQARSESVADPSANPHVGEKSPSALACCRPSIETYIIFKPNRTIEMQPLPPVVGVVVGFCYCGRVSMDVVGSGFRPNIDFACWPQASVR